MIKRTLLTQGIGLAKGLWGKLLGGGLTHEAKEAASALVKNGMGREQAEELMRDVGKGGIIRKTLGWGAKGLALLGVGDLLLNKKDGVVGGLIDDMWTDAGKIEANQNVKSRFHGFYQFIEQLAALFDALMPNNKFTGGMHRFAARGMGATDPDNRDAAAIAATKGGTTPSGPDAGGPTAGGPNNDNGGPGLGTVAAGVGAAGAGYAGYRYLKGRGAAAAANAADGVAGVSAVAATEAAEHSMMGGLKKAFRRNAVGAAIIGGATLVGSMALGSSPAEAAETTLKTAVPFGDSFDKAAHGDKSGAAKSATVQAAGWATSIAAGVATGAAVGSVVPGAGTLVGGAIGLVASVGGYMIGSGVAEKAWDSLSGLFNSKADPSGAPSVAMATNLRLGQQPALAM